MVVQHEDAQVGRRSRTAPRSSGSGRGRSARGRGRARVESTATTRDAVLAQHRVALAEEVLEVDVADVPRVVVAGDDDERLALDPVEVLAARCAYSSLKPKIVRSPEQTTTCGSSSLISAIARSSRLGTKCGSPQCRSEMWAIVNAGRPSLLIRAECKSPFPDRASRAPGRAPGSDPGSPPVRTWVCGESVTIRPRAGCRAVRWRQSNRREAACRGCSDMARPGPSSLRENAHLRRPRPLLPSSTDARRNLGFPGISWVRSLRVFANGPSSSAPSVLDYYGVPWEYEPRTFVLEEDEDGRVAEAFTPDFYLPEQDLYVEITVMKQSLVTRKNRKLRKLRERYPDVNVKLFYKRDIERLAERYRLDLASSSGRTDATASATSTSVAEELGARVSPSSAPTSRSTTRTRAAARRPAQGEPRLPRPTSRARCRFPTSSTSSSSPATVDDEDGPRHPPAQGPRRRDRGTRRRGRRGRRRHRPDAQLPRARRSGSATPSRSQR